MKIKDGFTLIELIIVMAIMGIMVTYGVPRLFGMQESSRAGEGIQVLTSLRSAQLRYCLDHAANCSGNGYPVACGTYDVDIPALRNFNAPVCQNDGMLRVDRNSGTVYRLRVSPAGTYDCVDTSDNPPCPVPVVVRILPQ